MSQPLKPLKGVLLFKNTQIAVFDQSGEQIPELQSTLLSLWADKAESLGYDPGSVPIEIHGTRLVKMEKIDGRWMISLI